MPLTCIRILSDGKPGHENQSLGLAEALQRRTGATVECVRLDPAASLWARIRTARRVTPDHPRPQLVIAAGHSMHWPLWAAARAFNARSVVIMKPSLPLALFDLCLVPRHDVKKTLLAKSHRLLTQGALNRIAETTPVKTHTGLILIGGPSKHHEWSGEPLLAAIAEIVRRQPSLKWTLTDSRRTPPEFMSRLAIMELPGLTLAPHSKTPPGWLPERLLAATQAWVTEDSVSMLYESITSGARTGLLPLPAKSHQGRIAQAVETAIESGYALRYSTWQATGELPRPTRPLHEAARCADEVLRRFFK